MSEERHEYWPLPHEELQALELGFRASNWIQETSQGWDPLLHVRAQMDPRVCKDVLTYAEACEHVRSYFG